jgi:signal peptidase I
MSRTASRTVIIPKSTVEPASDKPKETMRDFVEQIVVAIILAVLIRGYDAEAFVIPTGSMAPTLMGRHKEVTCPECGLVYAINASDDAEQTLVDKRVHAARRLEDAKRASESLASAEAMKARADRSGDRAQMEAAAEQVEKLQHDVQNAPRVIADLTRDVEQLHEVGLCVNCRHRTVVDDAPSFKGDRILVMKFPYELEFLPGSAGPKRWDVVVFHFPEVPETNYIKRLVGLPDEELRINHGDIQTRPKDSNAAFQIQRKPLIHQRAMQMLVHDDSHRPRSLQGKPEWRRWNPSGSWKEGEAGTFAATTGDDSGWSELRYRNLLPDPEQWAAIEKNAPVPRVPPRPTLITDFYSYNTNNNISPYSDSVRSYEGWLQSNWVGDLTLSCRVNLEAADGGGVLKFELIEAGISNRCEVDLVSGIASLYHGDKKLGESGTILRGTGAHDIEFANVDDRLTLLIDGEALFNEGLPYDDEPTTPYAPTARDLDPVGIGIKGAKATVSGLVLKRDIYYTQDPRSSDFNIPGVADGFNGDGQGEYARVIAMFDFLSDPAKFAALKDSSTPETYVIRPGHYMMMGDNSPRSSDSRAWTSRDVDWRTDDRSRWEVPRSMLIGKAFFVYWPHGKPFGPDIRINRDIRLPFRPYLERMKWIR